VRRRESAGHLGSIRPKGFGTTSGRDEKRPGQRDIHTGHQITDVLAQAKVSVTAGGTEEVITDLNLHEGRGSYKSSAS